MDQKVFPKKLLYYYKNLFFENKNWFLFALAIFVCGVVTGFGITVYLPGFGEAALRSYAGSIDQNIEVGFSLTRFVLLRNLTIATLASFLGAFFGLIPLIVTYINGALLGVVFAFLPAQGSVNPFDILLLTLPHGVIEYSATLLAMGFGLKLGLNWLLSTKGKSRKEVFVSDLKALIAVYPLIVLLLAIAALVEGLFTVPIACFLGGLCL